MARLVISNLFRVSFWLTITLQLYLAPGILISAHLLASDGSNQFSILLPIVTSRWIVTEQVKVQLVTISSNQYYRGKTNRVIDLYAKQKTVL